MTEPKPIILRNIHAKVDTPTGVWEFTAACGELTMPAHLIGAQVITDGRIELTPNDRNELLRMDPPTVPHHWPSSTKEFQLRLAKLREEIAKSERWAAKIRTKDPLSQDDRDALREHTSEAAAYRYAAEIMLGQYDE